MFWLLTFFAIVATAQSFTGIAMQCPYEDLGFDGVNDVYFTAYNKSSTGDYIKTDITGWTTYPVLCSFLKSQSLCEDYASVCSWNTDTSTCSYNNVSQVPNCYEECVFGFPDCYGTGCLVKNCSIVKNVFCSSYRQPDPYNCPVIYTTTATATTTETVTVTETSGVIISTSAPVISTPTPQVGDLCVIDSDCGTNLVCINFSCA